MTETTTELKCRQCKGFWDAPQQYFPNGIPAIYNTKRDCTSAFHNRPPAAWGRQADD